MDRNRRRTDRLGPDIELPAEPIDRARMVCDVLVERVGLQSAVALLVTDEELAPPMMLAGAGRVDLVADMSRALADRVEHEHRALIVVEPDAAVDDPAVHFMRPLERHAAMLIGVHRDGNVVLVVSDSTLSRREAEAIAVWAAGAQEAASFGGVCGQLAHDIAQEFDAEVVATAVFVHSSILVTLHARSGALIRAWRVPPDTVWGEAARHGAAFVLGDLRRHPGAEALESMGMQSAAVLGLENGSGIALGAVGIASRTDLPMEVADRLINMSPEIASRLLKSRTAPLGAVRGDESSVELSALAASVGCERFSVYTRAGQGALSLISAHHADGRLQDPDPDLLEEQLICWAAEQGGAVSIDSAAAVLIGNDTVLYARDAQKSPMTSLRNALIALRDDSGAEAA